MASSSNMPATRPRWSNTWLRYEGCSGMTISSEGEPIVKDLQRNTKITQIAKRGAERRFDYMGQGLVLRGEPFEWNEAKLGLSPHLTKAAARKLIRDTLAEYMKVGD